MHRYCRNCLYQLDHIDTPRCPECGQPFDVADPDTFLDAPRHPSASLRTLLIVGIALFPLGFALAVMTRTVSDRFLLPAGLAYVLGFFAVAFAVAGGAGTAGRTTCPPRERAASKRTATLGIVFLIAVLLVPMLLFTLVSILR